MTEVTDRIRKAPPQRFRRYSQYKDSGVEWLGEIPAHWEVRRLKFVTHTVAGQSPPSVAVTDRMDGTDGLPFLQGNAEFGPLSPKPQKVCDSAPKRAEPGDILLSVRAPVGAMNVADQPYGIGRGLCAIRPAAGLDWSFCFYEVMAMRPLLDAVATGSTYDAVTSSDVGDLLILLPHQGEQHAIADFLDRETAKIDGLVARKERLIELLQEKRTALITRAVTRGLDPNVTMKDSGVEWLGDIPAHWEVKRLSWLTNCLDGQRIPLNAEERGHMQGDYPYWGANSIVDYVDHWLFDEELVLLGEDGAPFFDRLRPVAFRVTGKIWVNNHAHVLRPQATMDAKFLAHALNCVDYRAFIDGSTRDKLTQGDMREIPIQCPEVKEQRVIAAFLERETAKIDAFIAKVRQAITFLSEFRTALISAAVTGKIDVREEAA